MKRRTIALVVLAVLLAPGAALSSTVTEFEGGDLEKAVEPHGPEPCVLVNFTVPAESYVLKATFRVSGEEGTGDGGYIGHPSNVSVTLDGAPVWKFNGTGAGPLGRQCLFSDGSGRKTLGFGPSGGTQGASFLLPAACRVSSASLSLECRGEARTVELAEWCGSYFNHLCGKSVSSAGDVNGDGFDDIIVGASGDNTAAPTAGAAFLFFGGPKLCALPNLTLYGEGSNSIFGAAVSGAGDLNGDGYDDIVVGAPWNSSGAYIGGAAYVFFGGKAMDARPDLVMRGNVTVGYLGMSLSGAGDVNGDGYDDLIVGESGADTAGQDSGAARIYLGGSDMDNVSDIDLSGEEAGDTFGWSVSGAGDADGDGYDDVLVGAYYNDAGGAEAGAAYLFCGGSPMDARADLRFTGAAAGDAFGYSVHGAGDLNGDGHGDMAVGAMRNSSNGAQSGRAYVYFGGESPDSAADLFLAGAAAGDFFGASVSAAGDVNGDGFDDLLVSAPWSSAPGDSYGQAYVFNGGSPMDGRPDITFNGTEYWDKYGFALSGAGDTNSDGYDEVVIGSAWEDVAGADSGRAIVYSNAPFLSGPAVTVAGSAVFSAQGDTAGWRLAPDFSGPLNAYLAGASPAGTFGSGNSYVEVPVKAGAGGPGNITLELSIFYDYNATVPDFSGPLNDYIAAHRGEADAAGNLTVHLGVLAETMGRVRLSGLDITLDVAPALLRPIPALSIDEDTLEPYLLDLYEHFGDDHDPPPALNFGVASATNGSIIGVSIHEGHYLSVDALAGAANDNWTGEVLVSLSCSDGRGLTRYSGTFAITVVDVNDAPAVTSAPLTEAFAGRDYEYRVTAVDAENDRITFRRAAGPEGMTIDGITGVLRWTPPEAGSFPVSVSVSDGKASTFQNFTIIVSDLNKPPIFISAPGTEATAGLPYAYEARAVDPDGDPLEYSLLAWPGGMAIGRTDGRINWTIPRDSAGDFSVSVKVSDGNGGEARQEFTIKVRPFARPKVTITAPADGKTISGSYIFAGSALPGSFPVAAVQVRFDSGEWRDATGNATWGFALDTKKLANGPHTLEARASDGTSLSDAARVRFNVDNAAPGPWPSATSMLALVLVTLAVAGAAAFLLLRRGHRRPTRYDWGPD